MPPSPRPEYLPLHGKLATCPPRPRKSFVTGHPAQIFLPFGCNRESFRNTPLPGHLEHRLRRPFWSAKPRECNDERPGNCGAMICCWRSHADVSQNFRKIGPSLHAPVSRPVGVPQRRSRRTKVRISAPDRTGCISCPLTSVVCAGHQPSFSGASSGGGRRPRVATSLLHIGNASAPTASL